MRPPTRSRLALTLASVTAALAAWAAATALLALPELLLPSPSAVAAAFVANRAAIAGDVAYTAVEVALGWGLGVAVGAALAAAIVVSPAASRLLYPVLVVVRLVPVVVFIPLLVLALGPTITSRTVVAALATFFPVVLATVGGLRSVPSERLAVLRVVGASRWQRLRRVRLPSALPSLFTGLTISAPVAVQAVVLAEYLMGSRGIGAALQATAARFETALLFAYVIALVAVSLLLFGAVRALERLVRWDDPTGGIGEASGAGGVDLPGDPASNALAAAAVFGAGALCWQIAMRAASRDLSVFLPAPLGVARTLVGSASLFVDSGAATLLTFGLGWGGGAAVGLALGAVAGLLPRVRGVVSGQFVAARSVPDVAIVPLFLIWFRVGPTTAALLVAVAAFFPVAVGAADGIARLPAPQRALLRSVDAPGHRVLAVRLRYALPQLFAGLKLSVVAGFSSTVIAEWFLTSDGVGVLLLQGLTNTDPRLTYAAALATAVLGMALYGAVAATQRRLSW